MKPLFAVLLSWHLGYTSILGALGPAQGPGQSRPQPQDLMNLIPKLLNPKRVEKEALAL